MMNQADRDRYVATTAPLYKKAYDPSRMAAVTARIQDYAENVLPEIMIDRRDPLVTASEENEQ